MLNERNTLLEDDGIEEEILVEEECSVAQAVWGDILGNIENQTDLQNALDAKQDSLTEAQLSAVNSGITSEKVTTYDGYADQIASKADQSALNAESVARGEADMALGTRIDNEALARQSVDNGLQTQIDAITSKSDVVDVVANYTALQAYDTSTLGNNDVVKVLDDETHEDALTYYRWSTTTQTWSYIGQEAPYYSKGQMDVKLAEKQDKLTAGANIQIQNGTISATDTTYTNGNGLNLNGTEFSADTDVLATKEDLEGYYTKPETDNLLAPKLEAEVVTELPTTGAEGKLYLTPKAHTTQTASGNPITATVAEEAGAIESFQLDGDTFQQTYTGQNLYDVSTLQVGSAVTVDDDGWITATKDNSAGSSSSYTNIWTSNLALEPNTQYAIFLEVKEVSGTGELDITSTNSTQGQFSSWQSKQISSLTAGSIYKVVPITKSSFSGIYGGLRTILNLSAGQSASITFRLSVLADTSVGVSSFVYEPYTGGQPSPSPSYPQQIQTVTGLQTVEVQGKNLLRYPYTGGTVGTGLTWTAADDGTIHAVGTIGGGNKSYYLYNRSQSDFDMPEIPAGTYKVFWSIAGSGSSPRITIQDANGYHNSNASNEVTIATSAKPTNIYIQFTGSQSGDVDLYIKPMIVPSDQADVYAPYSHQTLPLDLGSIELCKLGTYQDYIYKDGDDWKVHKEMSSITLDGTEGWAYANNYNYARCPSYTFVDKPLGGTGLGFQLSNYFGVITDWSTFRDSTSRNAFFALLNEGYKISIRNTGCTSVEDYESWLATNKPSFYYPVENPTDTTITDTDLIAQLEAIRTASLQNGTNTITNSTPAPNLTGDMEVGYYGYNPTNRYDKWLWLDLNNNYEQIGGE